MHSSFKISNLSDSQPLNIGVPSLFKVHSDRKSEEVKIYVDLGLEVSKLSATTDEQQEQSESLQRLKVEPHSFSLVSTTVTKELLAAEERARAREARLEKSLQSGNSNDTDNEPAAGQVERRRMFGGVKPNTRDPGKLSKAEPRQDNKQIFRRSQLEKQRALSASGQSGQTGPDKKTGGVRGCRPSFPTAPIPVSDLPPSAVRSPPARSAPVNPLLQNLKPIPPSVKAGSASPVKTTAGQKSHLISIQVPMAAGDGTQTMQTINIPRSVLAGASDRPILLTVTPKNGINKGQKQIVVLTKNNSGQTTASCHVPKSVSGSVSGGQTTRTIISTAGHHTPNTPNTPNTPQSQPAAPAKSIQLSPRPSQTASPASPVKPAVVAARQPGQPQQQHVIKGQIVETSAGQVLVQDNKQILLGKNVLQNGKLVLSQAQLAALTDKTQGSPQPGAQTGVKTPAQPAAQTPSVQTAKVGQAGGVKRTMISASQLQTMMAGGQKVVSVGTNAGGQRVVRVISGAGTAHRGVIQQTPGTPVQNGSSSSSSSSPAQNNPSTTVTPAAAGPATTTPGATASLSRILTALHNRGLVSQHQNGKIYYVGDKTKSPATPVSPLKIASSSPAVSGPVSRQVGGSSVSSVSSVSGITSLKTAQAQQTSVVVAPALSLDSFTADSDMIQAATSLLGTSVETKQESQSGGQESFVYRDPALPAGWYIKVGKRKVGELSYEVDVAYFSPDGAKLRSQEEVVSFLTGQLSVEDISHKPPVSLERMPWKNQLDEINKQLAPLIEIKIQTAGNLKRAASDNTNSGITEDKRLKADSFLRA